MDYEPVIGLEVHCQLKTATKLFCGCPSAFGAEPNTQVCPVCLGLPGVLPVINRRVIELATRAALALNCTVAPFTKFDRKNYFYPDLPKSYQISQFDRPFSTQGWIDVAAPQGSKRIRIHRAHVEEDAGKLIHPEIHGEDAAPGGRGPIQRAGYSFVDFNRCGVPLLEIVSEADLRSPEEAYAYLVQLKAILQYAEVSDCDMEKGSLRCDANISLRPRGTEAFGTKAEVKNMNSFRFVTRALEYEIRRQGEALARGERIPQETRLWDGAAQVTLPMRSKEMAHDYRYFPDPDLVPVTQTPEAIEAARRAMPEMPQARQGRFVKAYGLPEYDAGVLTADRAVADYFEEALKTHASPKGVSNWIMSEVLRVIHERNTDLPGLKLPAAHLAGLVKLFEAKSLTSTTAKEVFAAMLETGKPPEAIVQERGLTQITDEGAIRKVVADVVAANAKIVADYKGGKKTASAALVGQVMKATKGKANPALVQQLLKAVLGD